MNEALRQQPVNFFLHSCTLKHFCNFRRNRNLEAQSPNTSVEDSENRIRNLGGIENFGIGCLGRLGGIKNRFRSGENNFQLSFCLNSKEKDVLSDISQDDNDDDDDDDNNNGDENDDDDDSDDNDDNDDEGEENNINNNNSDDVSDDNDNNEDNDDKDDDNDDTALKLQKNVKSFSLLFFRELFRRVIIFFANCHFLMF